MYNVLCIQTYMNYEGFQHETRVLPIYFMVYIETHFIENMLIKSLVMFLTFQ